VILDEVYVFYESTSDVDALVESSPPIPDIYIHENDISDSEHVLVESSMLVYVTRYLLQHLW